MTKKFIDNDGQEWLDHNCGDVTITERLETCKHGKWVEVDES